MGQGHEIGGRHSTVMGLSILNNEMHLRNTSFQSPHHTYPFAICYEGDSRDNLEMNLINENKNILDDLCSLKTHKFYLSGDEMFLIKILDGSGELSPTSEDGWNLYHKAKKVEKVM